MARITVLVENNAAGQGLLPEHGLSFWIEHGDHRILFDTGQGFVLKHNAERLGIPLETADAVVLSHGHFDHAGGLAQVLETGKPPVVFAHPAAFAPRYAVLPGGPATARKRGCNPLPAPSPAREIGMPHIDEQGVRNRTQLVWTETPTEVAAGVWATGPVPRETDFEDTGGPFFMDDAGQKPDEFPDDQALYFETGRGTAVVLGCAHAGVINTLRYIRKLTDNRPLYLVIGGTHLVAASEKRMDKTVEEIERLGIERLMPGHCTGFPAIARLSHEFPKQYAPCPVGTVIEINEKHG